MKFHAVALALALAGPAAADGIAVTDAFVKSTGGAGAAYFTLQNTGTTPDRLVSVTADGASRAELHSSRADASGMMQMLPLTDGIPLPPGETRALVPGGDHLMLFGLPKPAAGASVTLHLTFEHAGEITVEAPVQAKP